MGAGDVPASETAPGAPRREQGSGARGARRLAALLALGALAAVRAQPFQFPTANHFLLENEGGEKFYVGTPGKSWTTGGFGCVRTEGHQMHEGVDIRCLERDRRGEPVDPVLATAAGTVVYINQKSALSNYGRYVVLRHVVQGLEVYSLYGHLSAVEPELRRGRAVKAGERIGTLGRTANTRQGIGKDRAHVHFELDLLVNDRFPAWFQAARPGQRNDHEQWNGQNLLGVDAAAVFRAEAAPHTNFSLLRLVQDQVELCRVQVRATNFPWLKRYAALVAADPRAAKEGVAGYELALNYNGLPYQLIPRAAGELAGKDKFRLLSVNEAEARARACRGLVARRRGRWELARRGHDLLELLTY